MIPKLNLSLYQLTKTPANDCSRNRAKNKCDLKMQQITNNEN